MRTLICWFRNDLRVADNLALLHACRHATHVLPVYCQDPRHEADTPWGFTRTGPHRQHFLQDGLADLAQQLTALGSGLTVLRGAAHDVLPRLAQAVSASEMDCEVVCEAIAAPEEEADLAALRRAGAAMNMTLKVTALWQSSLLNPDALPFSPPSAKPWKPQAPSPMHLNPHPPRCHPCRRPYSSRRCKRC
jgi:deoxyribodipyrimidine photo-lyase